MKKMICLLLTITLTLGSTITVSANSISENSIEKESVSENSYIAETYELSTVKTAQATEITQENSAVLIVEPALSSEEYEIPSYYNSYENGFATTTKTQVGDTCWAYAALATMESNLIKSGLADKNIDLSEKHLLYFSNQSSFDPLGNFSDDYTKRSSILTGGATDIFAPYYFLNQNGLVNETVTNQYTLTDKMTLPSDLRFQKDYVCNGCKNIKLTSDNTEKLKSLIMEKGGLYMIYYSDERYLNGNSYYYNGNAPANHAVEIIGWDDSYDASKFALTPEQNGAFLIKDSIWGFIWISYSDSVFASNTNAHYYEFTNTSYDNFYSYNGSSLITDLNGCDSYLMKYTSKTTENEIETVKAISIATGSENVSYTINVYKNPVMKEHRIDAWTQKEVMSGALDASGFYQITLANELILTSGDSLFIEVIIPREAILKASSTDLTNNEIAYYDKMESEQAYYGSKESDGSFVYADLYDICTPYICVFTDGFLSKKDSLENVNTENTTMEDAKKTNPEIKEEKQLQIEVGTLIKDANGFYYKITENNTAMLYKAENTSITKAVVPMQLICEETTFTVTKIGKKAFYNCRKLTQVSLPKSITSIGASAFQNCKKLQEITIPKKVETIGKKAFYNCKALKKVTIRSTSLKKVGTSAFKKIKGNAIIDVPNKKLKTYKKLLRNKTAKNVRIK